MVSGFFWLAKSIAVKVYRWTYRHTDGDEIAKRRAAVDRASVMMRRITACGRHRSPEFTAGRIVMDLPQLPKDADLIRTDLGELMAAAINRSDWS